jgi:purine-cytosine permease-like protein
MDNGNMNKFKKILLLFLALVFPFGLVALSLYYFYNRKSVQHPKDKSPDKKL